MSRKFKKRYYTISFFILFFACFSMFGVYMLIKSKDTDHLDLKFTDRIAFYINKDESVSIGEYLLYAASITQSTQKDYGKDVWNENVTLDDGSRVTFEDYMKRQIIEQIRMTKSLCLKANSYGISLTKEEEKTISSDAQRYLNSISKYNVGDVGIDLSTVLKVYQENAVSEKVYTHILKSYKRTENVDEESYGKMKLEYFQDQYENISKEFSKNWDYSTYVNHALLSTLSLEGNAKIDTKGDNEDD